jgi:vitamin B12 transporter
MHTEAETVAPPVVVTATRVPVSIEQIGSSVTVIDAETIARQQWHNITEALQSVPGLRVSPSGGTGAQTSVFTRGTNSNHTLILIDGVRAGDPSTPSGAYDFAHLQLENVERIEIVRGPQSTVYGSDAIGGVVNIITRRGHGGLELHGLIEGGSFNTHTESAGLRGAQRGFHYAFNVSHSDTHGQDVTPKRLRAGEPAEKDGYRNTTASAKLGYAPNRDTSFDFVLHQFKARSELDVGNGEDTDSQSIARQTVLRAEARSAFFNGLWRPMLAAFQTQHNRQDMNERQSLAGNEDHTRYRGERQGLELQNDLHLAKTNVLTVGAETFEERMKASGTSVYGDLVFGDFVITQNTDTRERARSAYLLDQFQIGSRWRGNAGIRWNDHDSFDPAVTWRVTPVFLFPETATRLKASYGTGFKAPSLYERYGNSPNNYGTAFTGNPNLLPEESTGWEAGFEQSAWGGRFEGGATYFSNRIRNLIQLVYLPSFDSTSENVSVARTWGNEVFVMLRPLRPLQLRLDYTYTRTQDADGLDLLRRPRHSARLNMEYRLDSRSRIGLESLYTGEREDVDRVTGARLTASDYMLVHLTASTNITKQFSLFGRLQNLFNREHEPVSGFLGTGRGLFAGVRGTF